MPTLNGWAHTMPLWSSLGLLGVDFSGRGLSYSPAGLGGEGSLSTLLLSLASGAGPCTFSGEWAVPPEAGLVVVARFETAKACSACAWFAIGGGKPQKAACNGANEIEMVFQEGERVSWEMGG